jgi:hypothetical protein
MGIALSLSWSGPYCSIPGEDCKPIAGHLEKTYGKTVTGSLCSVNVSLEQWQTLPLTLTGIVASSGNDMLH